MYRIAVIENDLQFAQRLRKKVEEESEWGEQARAVICERASEFLKSLEEGSTYDLCFVEVQMPETPGIELAERLRAGGSRMPLVFVSARPEYALDGYRVHAFDYLLKNSMDEVWDAFLSRARNVLAENRKKYYLIHTPEHIEKVRINDIVYIEKRAKNTVFILEETPGTYREISERRSLYMVQKELKGHAQFIQVNRGLVINAEKMKRVTVRELVMQNGERFSLGRARSNEIRGMIHQYLENSVKSAITRS